MMMNMTTMPTGMIVAHGIVWLVLMAFLLLGMAASIEYLRS
jgi:hypothetical protein